MRKFGPAATMTKQTVLPLDQSGAENHQLAPSSSSHAQTALGTTKALEEEPPHNSNSADLTPLEVKLSKTVGKEEGSDTCNLTALDVNDAIQNLPNVSSKKEKKNNFEKGKVIVGEKVALEKLLQEKLNEEKDLQTRITEVLRLVRSLEKFVLEVLNKVKDPQTGLTEALLSVAQLRKKVLNEEKDLQTGLTEVLHLIRSLEKSVVEVLNKVKDLQTGVTGVQCAAQNSSKVEEVKVLLRLDHENITGLYDYINREGVSEILMENAGPAATMTMQTIPPEDQSGAEYHQFAPSTSSHAQTALGTTKALEEEPPHNSNSADLTPLEVKLSKTVGKEEGSDTCNLTALDVNDAIQNLPNVSSKKEKKNNFEKGKVIVGEKVALEKPLQEKLNEEKDLQAGLTEVLRLVRSLEKFVVEVLNKVKDLQTGVTGVLCDEIGSSDFNEYSEGQHFNVVEFLGQGSSGSVDLCKDVNTNKEFALKEVKNISIVEEVKVLLRLDHENITGLYGYINREGVSEILMENAGMNLQKFVEESLVMEKTLVLSFTSQALSALKYLEEHQIMHLDFKPLNLCISNKNIMKLTDFGSAKMTTQEQDYKGWTPEYMAPEMCCAILKNHPPDFSLTCKVDVFALGLVVLFMLEKTHYQFKYFTERPDKYVIDDQTSLRKEVVRLNANSPNMAVTCMSMLTKEGSSDLKDLIKGLLMGIPTERLSAEEALLKIEALKKSTETEEELDLK